MARNKSTVIFSTVLIICIYLFTRHANNLFVEEQHLLFMASGLLELEIKRRDDLIARAREAVRQYSNLEGKIQTYLINLNAAQAPPGTNSLRLEKSNELFELLSEIDRVKERYPALKSSDPYLALMQDIEASGLRIINARLIYNRKVNEFNTLLHVFPYKIVARPLGFHEHPFQEGAGEKHLRKSN